MIRSWSRRAFVRINAVTSLAKSYQTGPDPIKRQKPGKLEDADGRGPDRPPGSDLPDYNTDVNIHAHRLKRPEKPSPAVSREWFRDLDTRTKNSLIPETLKHMSENEEFKITTENLKKFGQVKLTKEERKKRQRALYNLGVPHFRDFLKQQLAKREISGLLKRKSVEVLQLNIGLYCNQVCSHCHVESSPKRKEMMNKETAEKCLELLKNSPSVHTLDLTGGAPELCNEFRYLAKSARELGKKVLDRCNLTALLEPGQEDTAEFLAANQIQIVASLPSYSKKNVNLQRGSGVFDKSIRSLLLLNSLGYGKPGSGLDLDLVYNPLGAFLPPGQKQLEEKYREELWNMFGIEFNKLFTITNMPIKRFADFLYRRNELQDYMDVLVRNFNPATVPGLMCYNTLSVNWNGQLFDCDFNQQLDIGISTKKVHGRSDHLDRLKSNFLNVHDIESCDDLIDVRIAVDNHCFGCTAGMGSS
uniref:Uncharacterized protein LOC100373547 n=1 Tax=Saccoglossus kowalevskii TaxID=10224 RepID=A0ABM0LWT8_SACKO|nr:PREDICTED: uncharacterized protein LOC100373547 [Saccoglossus kowalevskii]